MDIKILIKNRKSAILILIIGLLFALLNNNLIAASTTKVVFNAGGEWYSTGFLQFQAWKGFIESFLGALMEVRIVEINNNIGLSIKDPLGMEYMNSDLIKFDKSTGNLKYHINLTLPNGEYKVIDYNFSINGLYNLSKFLNYNDYINKTIGDFVKDLGEKKLNVTLVGERSNVSVNPKPDGSFDVIYKKNIADNFTSPIPYEYIGMNLSENFTNYTVPVANLSSNLSYNYSAANTDESESEVNENVNIYENFEIINAQPNKTRINMTIGETKKFSIDNKDYDGINWKLDEKLVKTNSKIYEFNSVKIGEYKLVVEIKKGAETRTKSWRIYVVKGTNASNINWKIVGIIMIIIVVIVVGLVWFFVISKRSKPIDKDTNTILPQNQNF